MIPLGGMQHSKSVQCVMTWLTIIGLIPRYDYERNKFDKSKVQKCISLLIIALTLTSYYFILINMIEYHINIKISSLILEFICASTMTVSNVILLLNINYFNCETFITFLNKYFSVAKGLSYEAKKTYKKQLLSAIIVLHFSAFVFIINGIKESHIQLSWTFLSYYNDGCLFLIYNLISLIKQNFTLINEQLTHNLNQNERDDTPENARNDKITNITHLTKIYTVNCELLQTLSEIFGFVIFVITLNAVFRQLDFYSFLIAYQCSFDNVLWTLYYTGFVIILSHVCDTTTKAGLKTGRIAFKFLLQLDDSPESNTIRDSLILINGQSSMKNLQISAAGFFTMDMTSLYTIMNLTASYLIIIIQFND